MKLELKSKAVLAAVVDRLTHLDNCRRFVEDFRRHKLHERVIAKQAKSEYAHERGRFEGELKRYDELRRTFAQGAEIAPLTPVTALLAEIEELEKAEELVSSIGSAAHYDYEVMSDHKMRSRLDSLTGFDDSE